MSYPGLMYTAARRYLLPCILLIACAGAIFLSQGKSVVASGSTWQGYVLGCLTLGLIFWLALLGVRKRRYSSSGSMLNWVAAHIVFGLAVVVLALMHSAAQFGWNVHSFTFLLLAAVVLTGTLGAGLYVAVPDQQAALRQNSSRSQWFAELGEVDKQCIEIARFTAGRVEIAITDALSGTLLGGTIWRQLSGRDYSTIKLPVDDSSEWVLHKNDDQLALQKFLSEQAVSASRADQIDRLLALIPLVARRRELLARIRRDIRFEAWLKVWRLLHVPLTALLLGSVVAHVCIVFLYW